MIIFDDAKERSKIWWLEEVGYIAGVHWPRTCGPELV